MRTWGGRAGLWIGTVFPALLAAGSACLAAPRSLALSDGSVLSVWEMRLGSLTDNPDSGGSAIAYSISSPAGTRTGTVAPTADAGVDTSPVLAIDPPSGAAVLAWSRFDGVYFKIAYARFDRGDWTDFHYLTFGSGSDFEPRIGSSRIGSYLFWIAQGSRPLYAPVDLATGHLLAAPRSLRLGSFRIPAPMIEGGSVDGPNPPHQKNNPIWSPGDAAYDGGSIDGPSPPTKKNKDSVWGVGSNGACGRLVLVIPDPFARMVHVFSFANGTTFEIGRRSIPDAVPDDFADATAAAFLPSSCL